MPKIGYSSLDAETFRLIYKLLKSGEIRALLLKVYGSCLW